MICDCIPLKRLGEHLPIYRGVLKGPGKPAEALKSPSRQNTSSTPVSVNIVFQHSKFQAFLCCWTAYSFQHMFPGVNIPREMVTVQTSMQSKN